MNGKTVPTGTINNCPYCDAYVPPNGIAHFCPKQTKSPIFDGTIKPVSVWMETPIREVPHPKIARSMVTVHTGEEIAVVKCGDEEFRFSSWYGPLQ
jgi:hypothetical protein